MDETRQNAGQLEGQEAAAAAEMAAQSAGSSATETTAKAEAGTGAAATAAAATTANHDTQSAQEGAGEGGTAQEAAAAAVEVTEGKPAEQDTPPASAKADAAQKPDGEIASMRRELLTARAETEAARLNIPAERVPYVLRLAELDGIDPKGQDAAQQVRAAIDKVLGDVPELRGGGTGATGAFKTQRAAPKDAFERGFDRK